MTGSVRRHDRPDDLRRVTVGAMSPTLLPALSNVTVTLNEQYVGTIPVNASQPQYGLLTMNINAEFQLLRRLHHRLQQPAE
ncbi:MAG: cellulose biosynthesis cyclic di-GMP-binding regulatory protein BcsB [Acidocella sp.]|nr:cellulose biosynthesis cyclic di-GMP-binding regulatory protein BcsB [Acidocella sp.]